MEAEMFQVDSSHFILLRISYSALSMFMKEFKKLDESEKEILIFKR